MKLAAVKAPTAQRLGVREQSARATRESILKAATKIFAKHGFDGGRVEQISSAAKSYDRMIYYYFGSKEGLFVAVLEKMYAHFNELETELEIDLAQPIEALRKTIEFMAGYYQKHPEFVTLLNAENLHRGKHISKSLRAREYSQPAITLLDGVLKSGAAKALFRSDIRARDVYLMIAAMGYFYVSNRFTLSAFLGEDVQRQEAQLHWRAFIVDAVLRTVAKENKVGRTNKR